MQISMSVLSTVIAVSKYATIPWDHFSVAATGDLYSPTMDFLVWMSMSVQVAQLIASRAVITP